MGSEILAGWWFGSSSHWSVSVVGASKGKRVCTGVEDPARSHCWSDCIQHLAWWVGSDNLEGMEAVVMIWSPCIHWDYFGYK